MAGAENRPSGKGDADAEATAPSDDASGPALVPPPTPGGPPAAPRAPVETITVDRDASETHTSPPAWSPPSTIGVTLTVGATVFGIAGGFIQVADEPGKLWNMGAAVFAALAACLAFLMWQRARPDRRSGQRQIRAAVVSAALSTAVFAVLFSVNPTDKPSGSGARASAPTSAAPIAPSSDDTDIYLHEIMPSSTENLSVRLGKGDWAMTQFRVTQPYLRSVEVAAGSNGEKILLSVYDEHMREIASGEPVIDGYRAKRTFEHPKDVSDYMGSRLYLRATNLYGGPIRVYFTKYDADGGIESYLSCPRPRPLDCLNPEPQDLNALVVGRRAPW
jgi:hypothetical protein